MPRRKHAWEKLSDEQLLKQRLSSLRVRVEGTWLEDCLGTLNEELHGRHETAAKPPEPSRPCRLFGNPFLADQGKLLELGELTLYRGLQLARLRELTSKLGSLTQVEHVGEESSAATRIWSQRIP